MLGIHVSKESSVSSGPIASDISEAITRDVTKFSLNAAQIFTHGPRFFVPNKIDFAEVKSVTADINLSVHSAYATTKIWSIIGDFTSASSKKAIDQVVLQLLACKKIGAWGLVIHINKIYPDDAADVMHHLKKYAKKSGVKIVLEMPAVKADPDKTYETPEKIDNLTTLIGAKETYFGWCIDTSHIWAAGIDVRSYDSMKKWLDSLVHKHKILMFHLNGSSADFKSGKDKHEIVFGPHDKIWKGVKPEESGARAVCEFAAQHNIPVICEINRGAESDMTSSLETLKTFMM